MMNDSIGTRNNTVNEYVIHQAKINVNALSKSWNEKKGKFGKQNYNSR